MDLTASTHPLPDSQSYSLVLVNPTNEELEIIYKLSFAEWGDALTLPQYLEEAHFLAQVPLAKNGGMASWILTTTDWLPNHRPILASCETFRKRAFVSNKEGQMSENVVYGIASVFVNPDYRRRGYGARLMNELANILPKMHRAPLPSVASILYSDIGKEYYTKVGWPAFPTNYHIEFDPKTGPVSTHARVVRTEDLPQLCRDDEAMSQKLMASLQPGKTQIMIVPDIDQILWHISKEAFACQKIFNHIPQAKGALAGEYGCRIWVLWAHRYYGHPCSSPEDSTLYILRLAIEDHNPNPERFKSQVQYLKAVLQVAQAEAAYWSLRTVKLWHPTSLVQKMIEQSGLEYRQVDREEDNVASLRWFGDGAVTENDLEWVACEKYAWV
ncbi:MAG: hypothetical protein LQ342_005890 [Letrouitia transgressa]|nr:MAG: hypothetical protein LQ342_005890 [Letrouitia transgressa]